MSKKKDLVIQYLQLRGVDQVLQSLAESGREIMLDYIPELSDEAWEDLSRRVFSKMWEMYTDKFSDRFSVKELESIVNFYKGKVGKLLVERERDIAKQVDNDIRPYMKDCLEDIMAMIEVQDEILN